MSWRVRSKSRVISNMNSKAMSRTWLFDNIKDIFVMFPRHAMHIIRQKINHPKKNQSPKTKQYYEQNPKQN